MKYFQQLTIANETPPSIPWGKAMKGFAIWLGLVPNGLEGRRCVLPAANPLRYNSTATNGAYVAANPADSSSLRLG